MLRPIVICNLINLPIELKPSLAPLVPRYLSFCNPDQEGSRTVLNPKSRQSNQSIQIFDSMMTSAWKATVVKWRSTEQKVLYKGNFSTTFDTYYFIHFISFENIII